MKKNLFVLAITLLVGFQVTAQSVYGDAVKADVKMKYVYSLDEAMEKAKKEKKLIFFNAFADWAMPCHSMNKVVFSDQAFADYMDKTFVNFFIDVTTPEGKPLAEKYNIATFAHYLVLDANGEEVHRIIGGSKLPQFQEQVAMALSPKTSLKGTEELYNKGNRSKEILRNYAMALLLSDNRDKFNEVKDIYVNTIPATEFIKKENWAIFQRMLFSQDDNSEKWFQFLLDNKDAFVKENGQDIVNSVYEAQFQQKLFPLVLSSESYTAEKVAQAYSQIKQSGIAADATPYKLYEMAKLRGEKNNDKFIALVKEYADGFHPQLRQFIELSLTKLDPITPEQQLAVIEYLTNRGNELDERSKQQYVWAVNELTNNNGIIFEKSNFAEVLSKAKANNKPIFIDAFASWCGPCKMMASQVFTQKEVGAFFNSNFVNFKQDMEIGEGVELAKKYGIKLFPTFLIVNPDGELIHKFMGAMDTKTFIEKARHGLSDETSWVGLKKRYAEGERSGELMNNYLSAMNDAGENKEALDNVLKYLDALNMRERSLKPNWTLFVQTINDYKHPLFVDFTENFDFYASELGKKEVSRKVENVLMPVFLNYISNPKTKSEFTVTKRLVESLKLNEDNVLLNSLKMIALHDKQDFEGILKAYRHEQFSTQMDTILPHFLRNAPNSLKESAKEYIQSKMNDDSENRNTYQNIIKNLS